MSLSMDDLQRELERVHRTQPRVILCNADVEQAVQAAVDQAGAGERVFVVASRYVPGGQAFVVAGAALPGDGDPREYGGAAGRAQVRASAVRAA